MTVRILQGDCVAVMKTLADDSVDAVVTDPPYHLTTGKKGGSGEASVNLDSPYGRSRIGTGFMGMTWDGGDVAFRKETWAEMLRVLKPGGHLLAFSGTRTYHRMVCAIEDAGFEIRDQIGWVYGSGFPKSLDVSKAIDKAGGASPVEQAALLRQRREAAGLSREQVAAALGCTASSVRDWEEGRARATGAAVEFIVPSEGYRAKLADLLGYSADERRITGATPDRRDDGTVYSIGHSGTLREGGATEAARQWQGWGTALKPAWEPIVVARKPLIGTVAANVLAHGTGALNIDGCRVPNDGELVVTFDRIAGDRDRSQYRLGTVENCSSVDLGRWPANLIHDGGDEVLAAFPQAPGQLIDQSSSSSSSRKNQTIYGALKAGNGRDGESSADSPNEGSVGFKMKPGARRLDEGSAARFFYCAKASKSDRGADNIHPTVKPTELMRYLCRLVTPPGGVVLDPFMGSGSTLKAAELEGFSAIGIELDPAYIEIARRRIAADAPLFAQLEES